jgi:predicted nucleic acid-binding protein
MSELIFVDTNVLVYVRDASEVEKQPRAQAWMSALWRTRRGRLSVQVLEEFYVTVTQKLKPGLSRAAAREDARALAAWRPIALEMEVVEVGWALQDRHRLSFWDSLIIAAAAQAGCRYLLTEDLQDGQEFDGVRVIDPFKNAPADYLRIEDANAAGDSVG